MNLPAEEIARLHKNHNFIIDGGYGKIKGKTFHISNMGDETEQTITTFLTAHQQPDKHLTLLIAQCATPCRAEHLL